MVPSSDAPDGAPFTSGRKRILVVEDEFLIRMMVSDELRDAGFDVIEAFNAEEALTVLNSQVQIDLIFSDVRMPGSIDGMGLLTFVKENFPKVPMIITSADLSPHLAIAQGAAQFLAKPFVLEVAVSAVQNEIARTHDR